MSNLTKSEEHELIELCIVWNNLYGNVEYDPDIVFPLKRIRKLNEKSNIPTLLRVKGGLEVIFRVNRNGTCDENII